MIPHDVWVKRDGEWVKEPNPMDEDIKQLRSALSQFTEGMPRSETVESLEIDAGAFGYRDLISWLKKVTSTPCLCQGGYNPDCPSDHGSVPIAQGEV